MNTPSWQQQAAACALARLAQRAPHSAQVGQLQLLQYWQNCAAGIASEPPATSLIANGAYAFAESGFAQGAADAMALLAENEAYRWDRELLAWRAQPAKELNEPLLLATNIGRLPSEEANARQEVAMAHLTELAKRDGNLILLNVAEEDELTGREGWLEVALTRNARDVVDPSCRPIPIARDIFEAAAEAARARGIRTFGYVNSDIFVTEECLWFSRLMRQSGFDSLGFTRTDIDNPDGMENPAQWKGLHFSGTDLFFWDLDWWDRFGPLFEPYVLGAYWWDCVYMGIMLLHGRLYYASQQRGALFHVLHDTISSGSSKQADFNLSIRNGDDAPYFQIHSRYCDNLQAYIRWHRCLPAIKENLDLLEDKYLRNMRALGKQ